MVFISIQSLLNSPCFDAASPSSTLLPHIPPDMVASSNGELYTPFPHMQVIEEGVQSSEEGSDLHSPTYEPSYATADGTCTLSRCSSYTVHMSDWFKKAGIRLDPSSTMSLARCNHRRRHLTLAIRPWIRTPEIPISWRHYNSRALQLYTITRRRHFNLPTWFFMDTRCLI